eukprot:XP_028344252.1 uncharacterized protein LOC114486139 [Physeter catodon]
MEPLDRQCMRLLGSAPQEDTEQTSVVLRTSGEGGRSQQREHPSSRPGEDVASSTGGVNGNGATAGDGGGRPEELQESLQGGRDNMRPRRSGWRSFFVGRDGRGASCDRREGAELQSISSTTDSVNGIADGGSRGEDRALILESESRGGAPSSTGNVNRTGDSDRTDEEPPPYEETVNRSRSERQDRRHPGGPGPFDDYPPSYLDVLMEDEAQRRRLIAELTGAPGVSEHGSRVIDSFFGGNGPRSDDAVVTLLEALESRSRTVQQPRTRRRLIIEAIVATVISVGIPLVVVLLVLLKPQKGNATVNNTTSAPTTNISQSET